MYCKKCGELISDDSRFCKECGVRVFEESSIETNKEVNSLTYICKRDNIGIIAKCSICNRRVDIENDNLIDYNKADNNYEFSFKYPVKCECGSSYIKIKLPVEIKHDNNNNIQKTTSKTNVNIPKCPTCGSPKIGKISAANKVGAAAVFGVFSVGHLSKTYQCYNCKYKW